MSSENIVFLIYYGILFICPGYCTVKMFRFFRGQRTKEEKPLLIKSIIISVMYLHMCGVNSDILKEIVESKDITVLEKVFNVPNFLLLLLFSVIIPIILNYLLIMLDKWGILEKLKIKSSIYDDCLYEYFKLGHDGVWGFFYLDNEGVAYRGSVYLYDNISRQICLKKYKRYIRIDGQYIADENDTFEDNKEKVVMLEMDRITRYEFKRKIKQDAKKNGKQEKDTEKGENVNENTKKS